MNRAFSYVLWSEKNFGERILYFPPGSVGGLLRHAIIEPTGNWYQNYKANFSDAPPPGFFYPTKDVMKNYLIEKRMREQNVPPSFAEWLALSCILEDSGLVPRQFQSKVKQLFN